MQMSTRSNGWATSALAITQLLSPLVNARRFEEGVSIIWRNRALCLELLKRDLGGQYAGQFFGSIWVFAHPVLLLSIYIFVFAFVFDVRLGGTIELPRDYVTYLVSGLIPWVAIQTALGRTANALVGQANLVKQVVFPIQVLPFGAVLVAVVPQVISLAFLLAYMSVRYGQLPWTIVLVPFAVALEALFLTGIAFVLAVLTPFFRDLKDFIAAATLVGVYLVPAFYTPQMVSSTGRAHYIFFINPFSYVVWLFQDLIYYGRMEHPLSWVAVPVLSVLSFALGYRLFVKLKPYVANVL
jgi:lipopolysaccharide transport system permease protein